MAVLSQIDVRCPQCDNAEQAEGQFWGIRPSVREVYRTGKLHRAGNGRLGVELVHIPCGHRWFSVRPDAREKLLWTGQKKR